MLRWLCCGVLISLMAGCGSGSDAPGDLVPVRGQVTIDGNPLSQGIISLIPESGGPAFSGSIAEGIFSVDYSASAKGVPAGKYTVIIRAETAPASMDEDGNPVEATLAIPARYSDPTASGLTLDAQGAGGQDFIFDLFNE